MLSPMTFRQDSYLNDLGCQLTAIKHIYERIGPEITEQQRVDLMHQIEGVTCVEDLPEVYREISSAVIDGVKAIENEEQRQRLLELHDVAMKEIKDSGANAYNLVEAASWFHGFAIQVKRLGRILRRIQEQAAGGSGDMDPALQLSGEMKIALYKLWRFQQESGYGQWLVEEFNRTLERNRKTAPYLLKVLQDCLDGNDYVMLSSYLAEVNEYRPDRPLVWPERPADFSAAFKDGMISEECAKAMVRLRNKDESAYDMVLTVLGAPDLRTGWSRVSASVRQPLTGTTDPNRYVPYKEKVKSYLRAEELIHSVAIEGNLLAFREEDMPLPALEAMAARDAAKAVVYRLSRNSSFGYPISQQALEYVEIAVTQVLRYRMGEKQRSGSSLFSRLVSRTGDRPEDPAALSGTMLMVLSGSLEAESRDAELAVSIAACLEDCAAHGMKVDDLLYVARLSHEFGEKGVDRENHPVAADFYFSSLKNIVLAFNTRFAQNDSSKEAVFSPANF